MTVKKKEIQKYQVTEVDTLKAAAYDEIAKIEEYQRGIQQCQQKIQKINEEIIKRNLEGKGDN